ncbi:glutamate--tRNA ligase [Desulfovermiculus halophilus]|jgi:glutamyl-tRNA synthetase|uniref:glutamate--tRNA ligase n=1 Tax=Desulfovermiculus halophilus TaxID=339722 RepID=UPI0004813ADD|nr:glutamate--tRNA ligase [Desulfovermiculus halophilus]
MTKHVVTRFPPSPTGNLHIGGARTALFNWLLARSQGGKFILRIEDTDVERSTWEMTEGILESMRWLGMDWDEGPYFQSQRLDVYNEHIERLLASGKAYYCQCSADEVEAMREEARAKGLKPKYNGRCRELGLGPGPGRVVRLKAPLDGETGFEDLVRGYNRVDNRELDDFVLRRADGMPTYNLAVVVDDALMGMTHILRGDDHMSNTPKQVLLYQALGFDLPSFGHVPMILGPDKKKLSKRHGAMSVLEYRDRGYLPQAVLNTLVRLGWSHGDQELFEPEELISLFSLHNLGKSACVFNPEKLDWVNSQHIKNSPPADLVPLLAEQLQRKELPVPDAAYLEQVIPLLQPRAATMADMADQAAVFVLSDEDIAYDPDLVGKVLTAEVRPHLQALIERLQGLASFDQSALEESIRAYLEETGIKFKLLAQPIRVAVTGKKASPGLFETMEVLGKAHVLRRMERALQV